MTTGYEHRVKDRIIALVEQIRFLRTAKTYSALWRDERNKRVFDFTFSFDGETKVYTFELEVKPNFYLCPGEARFFTICTMFIELIDLLKQYTELTRQDDSPSVSERDNIRGYSQQLDKIADKAGQVFYCLTHFQHTQQVEFMMRRLADKTLLQKLQQYRLGYREKQKKKKKKQQ